MKKFRQIKSFIKSHKKATIIVAACLIVTAAVIYGLICSVYAWSNYDNNFKGHFNSAKADIDGVLLPNPTKNNISAADKLARISAVKDKLSADAKTYCKISALVKWQDFVGQNLNKIKECEARKALLNQLLGEMDGISAYLKDEQKLAAIISDANLKTNQNNQLDKWHLVEAFWRQAATDTSKLSKAGPFKDTNIIAVSALTKIADSWKSLSAANDSKNRQNFDQSKVDQVKACALLAGVSDKAKAGSEKLISDLTDSYSKAF